MNNTLQRIYFTIDVVLPFASALVHGCGRDHPALDTVDLEYFWGGYGLNFLVRREQSTNIGKEALQAIRDSTLCVAQVSRLLRRADRLRSGYGVMCSQTPRSSDW
jgi:hypothetical protein